MNASHDSLRDDYEVSAPELDLLVDAARARRRRVRRAHDGRRLRRFDRRARAPRRRGRARAGARVGIRRPLRRASLGYGSACVGRSGTDRIENSFRPVTRQGCSREVGTRGTAELDRRVCRLPGGVPCERGFVRCPRRQMRGQFGAVPVRALARQPRLRRLHRRPAAHAATAPATGTRRSKPPSTASARPRSSAATPCRAATTPPSERLEAERLG